MSNDNQKMQTTSIQSISSILGTMTEGPGPEGLDLPQLVSHRLPRRDSIRTWRRPNLGMDHKRKDQRFHFVANVLISSKNKTILGKAQNISKGGIFITTDSAIFAADEELDITIVPIQGSRSYQIKGKVTRKKAWPIGARGYALSFLT